MGDGKNVHVFTATFPSMVVQFSDWKLQYNKIVFCKSTASTTFTHISKENFK